MTDTLPTFEGQSTSRPIIELQNVSRQFGSQQVLRDISMEVYAGRWC